VIFQLLKIGGVVGAGEGVLAPAVLGNDARELTILVGAGAFKHHVFEDM